MCYVGAVWEKHYKVKAVDDKFGLIGFSAPLGLPEVAGGGGASELNS